MRLHLSYDNIFLGRSQKQQTELTKTVRMLISWLTARLVGGRSLYQSYPTLMVCRRNGGDMPNLSQEGRFSRGRCLTLTD